MMPLQKYLSLIAVISLSTGFSIAQEAIGGISLQVPDSIHASYPAPPLSLTDSIVNYGKLFLNTPYHYGSSGTDTFDCSGFTSYVYRNFGYNLQHSSADQAQQFDTVNRTELRAGDLVYFSGHRRSKRVGHVGIVVQAKENGEFDFIHAAVRSGVTISSSAESYYSRRFVKANRVVGANPLYTILPELSKTENQLSDPFIPTPFTSPVKQTKRTSSAEYHLVKSGETLSSIAEKYDITIAELKEKNHLIGNKINRKQRLIIKDEETVLINEPIVSSTEKTTEAPNVTTTNNNELAIATPSATQPTIATHIVKKGETLFSISKLYSISVEELKKINKLQRATIQPNQEILLNEIATTIVAKSDEKRTITSHKVQPGESLFSISKIYDISIEDIKKINKLDNNSIRAGQALTITQPKSSTEKFASTSEKKSHIATHIVKSGDSLFLLAKIYGCTVDEIKKSNNKSNNKLNIGDKLIIDTNKL